MIKAIIFDFYGVVSSDDLWDFVGVDRQGMTEIHGLSDEVNMGQISWETFCNALSVKSGKSVEEINTMYSEHHINREIIGLINELKPKFKIGLLTNANTTHINEILERINATDLFDSLTISSELGVIKPQPAIYRAALNNLGVEASEAIFIDDAQRNVEGAIAEGIVSILYRGEFAEFSKELKVLLQG